MKLKTDASGNAVLQDGKPVYVSDDGTELALDAAKLYGQVRDLTKEAGAKRKALEAAEAKLSEFADIEDPKAAREALEAVKSLDGKSKADIEKARSEVATRFQKELDAERTKVKTLESSLHSELIGGGFARSKFITENLSIPAELAQSHFGRHFVVENGRMVAKDANGNVIGSKANPAEPASFDEAIETLVSGYAYKDHILKATQKGGSGAQPGTGGAGGTKQMTVSAFDALSPKDQAARMSEGYVLTD